MYASHTHRAQKKFILLYSLTEKSALLKKANTIANRYCNQRITHLQIWIKLAASGPKSNTHGFNTNLVCQTPAAIGNGQKLMNERII